MRPKICLYRQSASRTFVPRAPREEKATPRKENLTCASGWHALQRRWPLARRFILDRCAETADPPVVAGDLDDKFVVVYLDPAMRSPSVVLVNPKLKQVGGRWFLHGTGADTHRENDWRKGVATRVAWNNVSGYYAYSEQEYEDFLKSKDDDD